MIEAAELSSNRGEVAVKTTCGHVIGKSEAGAYVFKVSLKKTAELIDINFDGESKSDKKKYLAKFMIDCS